MCGISGILYRHPSLYSRLGADLLDLIQPLESRGPDSCGVALYRTGGNLNQFNILLRSDASILWHEVRCWLDEIAPVIHVEPIANAQRFCLDIRDRSLPPMQSLRRDLLQAFPHLHWMSAGHSLEIYKEVGAVKNLDNVYELSQFSGSHGIGHTRMATESVVDTDHCHPFATGYDLAIVHNGQISNYYRLRFQLERAGVTFVTHNDSEILAHYIHFYLQQGKALQTVLQQLLDEVDGSYTFLVSTIDQIALVRDRMATKPAVVYETENMVAIASEYRALMKLPNFDARAAIREPDAGEINLWSTATLSKERSSIALAGA